LKQSDPLELVDAGTLVRPGLVGRAVRMALGVFCLYALFQVIRDYESIVAAPITALPGLAIISGVCLCIINYVVNIGFSKNWGRWPAYASLGGFAILGAMGFVLDGGANSAILGLPFLAWLVYFYSHLGVSFVLASLIATPGCEMRSVPELFARMNHRPSEEHQCPAAFITKIDEWEQRRLQDVS